MRISSVAAWAPVVFVRNGDINRSRAITLEARERVLDVLRRELHPMALPLMGVVPFRWRHSPGRPLFGDELPTPRSRSRR